MGRYYIWTIGCQMNVADSERLGSHLEQLGYQATERPENADIVVLNSCVVRQSAEDRVVNKLASLRPLKRSRPDAVLALMGCMVDSRTEALKKRFPHVDVFMKPQVYAPLLELARERAPLSCQQEVGLPLPTAPGPTVFIPIIQGCDEFCTFCIVPYRRGRQRSRPIAVVRQEVEILAQRGVKEVTLLGQTVDAYGYDLPEQPDLADLLEELNPVPGLARIRFLTSHPRYMTHKLIAAVARLDRVCEFINLPFQAGDDDVLRAMRRTYTIQEYRQLMRDIRGTIPNVSLSTDVIVGFCKETEEQFRRTLDLLEEVRFDKVHVAAYSTRPGTIAARTLADNVPLEVKRERLQRVEELQERIATEINADLLGQRMEILVEERHKGQWQGRTRTNKLVFFPDDIEYDRKGELVEVLVTKAGPWALQGQLTEATGSVAHALLVPHGAGVVN